MIWKGWRDVSGKKMKDKYVEFVKLSNEGIQELNMGMNEQCKNFFIKYVILLKFIKNKIEFIILLI